MRKKYSVYLLLAFAVLVFFKAGIWVVAKSLTDKIVAQLSPYADISYRTPSLSLKGQLTLSDVTIAPLKDSARYQIGDVFVTLPDLTSLLTYDTDRTAHQIPRSVEVELKDIQVDQPITQTEKNSLNFCGDALPISRGLFEGLKHRNPKGSLRFKYSISGNQISWELDTYIKQGFSSSTDFYLSFEQPPKSFGDLFRKEQGLLSFRWEMIDEGIVQKRNEVCAKALGLDSKKFTTLHLKNTQQQLAEKGILLSQNIWNGYIEFLTNAKSVGLSGSLQSPAFFHKLHLYNPADIISQMEVTAFVTDNHLTDVKVAWNPQSTDNLWDRFIDKPIQPEPVASDDQASDRQLQIVQKTFQSVAFEQLSRYINSEIQVISNTGREYAGILLEVTGNEVIIRRQMVGGNADYTISKGELVSLKVKK